MSNRALRKYGTGVALAASGVVAGAVLAGTLTANAETSPSPTPAKPGSAAPRPVETPLSGDVADKVRAAALAKYPGATIERLETDADGVYEAHLTTAAGEHLTVEVDKAYAVTGTEKGGPGPGPGGPGPRGGGPAETPLTGDVAAKVRAAALAKYPGATIERLETDADGVYEAHLTTAAGEHLTVEVDKAYAVTGTEAHGPGGPGGPARHHGPRPDGAAKPSPSASPKTS